MQNKLNHNIKLVSNNILKHLKNTLKWENIVKIALFLFLFSLFFPIRKVILSENSYLTGDYSDFTSFSWYISDILLYILAILMVFPREKQKIELKQTKWLVLWLIVSLITKGLSIKWQNIWFLAKFIELIVAYGTLNAVFKKFNVKHLFLQVFVTFSTLQGVIAILQFIEQHSIGLSLLGEQVINPNKIGVAKLVVEGTRIIRGYGTFPHPNLLSAFLVTGVLINIYLLIKEQKNKNRLYLSLILFINVLGLGISFSRGAILSLIISSLLMFGIVFLTKQYDRKTYFALAILAASFMASFIILKPYVLTRATFADQSTLDRIFYDKQGIAMIKDKPWFGVGIGESVLALQNYTKRHLAPWEKQPPHNYFLVAAAESGAVTALLLIWIFLTHLYKLLKKLKKGAGDRLYFSTLIAILCSFLLLMQFDHYFYTLEQTQMLLWTVLALISSETDSTSNKADTI